MNNSIDNTFGNNFQSIGTSVGIGNSNDSLGFNILDRKSSAHLSADGLEQYLSNTVLPLAQTALREFENSSDFHS